MFGGLFAKVNIASDNEEPRKDGSGQSAAFHVE
jgi:hypothetical protein